MPYYTKAQAVKAEKKCQEAIDVVTEMIKKHDDNNGAWKGQDVRNYSELKSARGALYGIKGTFSNLRERKTRRKR